MTQDLTGRRKVLKTGAATAAMLSFPFINTKFASAQAGRPLKIGYVIPKTGPLAVFAETDRYVLGALAEIFKKGVTTGGKNYPVQIIEKDSQSTPNRAGEVASDLILKDKVDLMVAGATPETVNPVGDQCELNEVPCITTLCPWQPWFFTRGGDPAKGFNWTYHYFWGLEDIIAVFTNMWDSLSTNKTVGALFPNDGDGNAWGDPERGFPKPLAAKGYKLTDPGRYQNLQQDFSAQIAAFKKANCDIVTGVVIPPDFKTFWTQAAQQGYKPKAVSVGKAYLVPPGVEAIGDIADGLSSEIFWAMPTRRAPDGNGHKFWDTPTRCSKWPWMCSSAARIPKTRRASATPSCPPTSIPWWVPSPGAKGPSRTWPSARLWAANGSRERRSSSSI
jgi:branched-chain amino acid transport system substrate-binding protein